MSTKLQNLCSAEDSLLIRRCKVLPGGGPSDISKAISTVTTLAELGYAVNPAKVTDITYDFVSRNLNTLKETVGEHITHTHLFEEFPNISETNPRHFGLALLNLSGFQFPIPAPWLNSSIPLTEARRKKITAQQSNLKGDSATVWKNLSVVDDTDGMAVAWAQKTVNRPFSLSADEVADVTVLMDKLDATSVSWLETRMLFVSHYWNAGFKSEACDMLRNPDDVLRLFTLLTDAPVSLTVKMVIPKLSRPERKLVVATLNRMLPSERDSLWTKRGLWLNVARFLHMSDYFKYYPNAGAVFSDLKENRRNSGSWNSKVEAGIASKNRTVLGLLAERPGVFARKVRTCLNVLDENEVLGAFRDVVNEVPLRILYVLKQRNLNPSVNMMVTNKKGVVSFPKANFLLSSSTTRKLDDLIADAINTLLSDPFISHKTVWVDDNLSNIVLPMQRRTASNSSLSFASGSRLTAPSSKVLRLFLYWVGQDLDLSLLLLDKDFCSIGQVSYTNIKEGDIVHSGDITYAPKGATEYIDIPVSSLSNKVKYLAPQVHNYSGPDFEDIEAFSGWMWCNDPNAKAFDGKTVENKFEINGTYRSIMPFVFDVAANEVVMTDIPVHSGGWGQNVDSVTATLEKITANIVDSVTTRPTVGQVVNDWVTANGLVVVKNKADADKVFELDTDISELLA